MTKKKTEEPIVPEEQPLEDPGSEAPGPQPEGEPGPGAEGEAPPADVMEEQPLDVPLDGDGETDSPAAPGDADITDDLSRLLSELDDPPPSTGEDGVPGGDDLLAGEDGMPGDPPPTVPEKPKRAARRKKAASLEEPSGEDSSDPPPPDEQPVSTPPRRTRTRAPDVLTIEARGEVTSEEEQKEAAWHEVRNAYRTHRILTGTLGGIEQLENGKSVAIVEYKGFRVVIPIKEMMLRLGRSPTGEEYAELMRRQNRILSTMLGAEIDFVIKGIEAKSRSIVASRKDAMLKKRQIFYMSLDDAGMYRIYEGRIVQARVIAVAEKVVRVEAFGVECSILARDLAWDWIGDAHERFSVGDQILVRILSVQRNSLEDITIQADAKSVSSNTDQDNLKKCRIQSKYAGRVTDVRKGVVYIRLANGVNAIAHACYDRRMPGKKDDVSFAVTHIDEDYGVAVGIITRIIKQNL